MNQSIIVLIKLFSVAITTGIILFLFHKRISFVAKGAVTVCVIWIGLFSGYLADTFPNIQEEITVTALSTKNEQALWNQIVLLGYEAYQEEDGFFYTLDGTWPHDEKGETSNENYWYWVSEGEDWKEEITPHIRLHIPVGTSRTLLFGTGLHNGHAQIDYAGNPIFVDTFAPEASSIAIVLPDSTPDLITRNKWEHLPPFLGIFFTMALCLCAGIFYLTSKKRFTKIKEYRFLFVELIKRDFTLKYKRTVLGMLWSILSPLFNLLVMWLVFNNLLGQGMEHYVIYLFIGQLIFSYFSDATTQGMTSLLDNAGIFTKVNVPKYMFLLSKNISSLINFGLTMILLSIFIGIEGIPFRVQFLVLVFPTACLIIFNVGVGLFLSALFVFFRDVQYLWGIFTQLLMWLSATFYSITTFSYNVQCLFLLNPLYLFNRYFRKVIIDGTMPELSFHFLLLFYTLVMFGVGCYMYKKYNHEFLYYV